MKRLTLSILTAFLAIVQPAAGQLVETKLVHPEPEDFDLFGWSVSLDGERALIGAFRDNAPLTNNGSAFVFERQVDGAWIEAAMLTASDPAHFDEFGVAVALRDEVAFVTSPLDDCPPFENCGAVYVFERQEDGSWMQVLKMTASDGDTFDLFGHAVSLSGARALVGAHQNRVEGFEKAGAAYIFEEIPIIVETSTEAPETPLLSSVAPNPFVDHAQVTLTPGTAQHVRVEVYDMLGRRAAVVHEGVLPGGVAKSFTLNATSWPGGVYVLRAAGETFVESRTLTVIR